MIRERAVTGASKRAMSRHRSEHASGLSPFRYFCAATRTNRMPQIDAEPLYATPCQFAAALSNIRYIDPLRRLLQVPCCLLRNRFADGEVGLGKSGGNRKYLHVNARMSRFPCLNNKKKKDSTEILGTAIKFASIFFFSCSATPCPFQAGFTIKHKCAAGKTNYQLRLKQSLLSKTLYNKSL